MGISDWVNEITEKGRYDLYTNKRKIGVGGFSRVYSVERDGLRYAMKEPKMEIFEEEEFDSGTIGPEKMSFKDSFMKEMRVWARLTDTVPDDVVCLIDCNKEPHPWMVMELAECDYSKAIKDGSAGPEDLIDLLESLQRIHDAGVIHRDIKPKNIMKVNGKWKFSDFGLSRVYNSTSSSGTGKGTIQYMAPEQHTRKYGNIDERTDIWQMGIILFEIVTNGKIPYHGTTDGEIMAELIGDGPDISGAPDRYQDVLKKALSVKSQDRYRDAQEFSDELKMMLYNDLKKENSLDRDEMLKKGNDFYYGKGVAQSYKEAMKWYRLAADQGDARAQYNLGICYENGRGVAQSYEEAVKWYRLAADQGHARAQYNLGICYENGQGVAQSYEEAVKWYRLAADQGHEIAQYNLGYCYKNGHGVAQSYGEAVKWYRLAADQGLASAQNNLGICYENGRGVAQSYEEAVKWYRLAADQGHARAQYNLGICYENGQGVAQSYEEAVKWYRLAADQGDAYSQYNLGVCYENGQGVAQSYEEAVKWYRLAADQGHEIAQFELGFCYAYGQGVAQSYTDALYWYKEASKNGCYTEEEIKIIEQKLSKTELADTVNGKRKKSD